MNSRDAASSSQTTTAPPPPYVNSAIGTVAVTGEPCSAHANRARSQMCTPESTVSAAMPALAAASQRSGFEKHGRAGRAVRQRRDELPLVDDPVQIGARGRPGAHIAQRISAVQLLAASRQVDACQGIADRFRRAHRDPADSVHDVGEPAESDLGVVVEPQPRGLFDCVYEQLRTSDREGRIDLVAAVSGD